MDEAAADALRSEIRRLGPWHHDIELASGIRTGEISRSQDYPDTFGETSIIDPRRNLAAIVQSVFPGGLGGRSFLDCACNAGGYVFAAAEMGAGRGFGFDVREHWIAQARLLSRYLPGPDISFATRALADLPALRLEPFDVTLFSGIFYHLPDPVTGLRLAADHTRELLIVNTAIRLGHSEGLQLNQESRTDVMSGVEGLAWFPTGDRVVREILAWCGFPHTRLDFRRVGGNGFGRIQIFAARNEETFSHYDRHRAAVPDRRRPLLKRVLRKIGTTALAMSR